MSGIDARRLDPDHDLTGAWFGIGDVVDPQFVNAAEPVITHHSDNDSPISGGWLAIQQWQQDVVDDVAHERFVVGFAGDDHPVRH